MIKDIEPTENTIASKRLDGAMKNAYHSCKFCSKLQKSRNDKSLQIAFKAVSSSTSANSRPSPSNLVCGAHFKLP